MSLAEIVVKRRVTVVMLTMGLMVIGIISFLRLPQELFPPITFPQITIVTEYVNAAPEEIETLITRPIEETVSSVAGLKRLESTSREGRSTIKVSFNWGQNVDFAALSVREKIDAVKERLPKEASDPVVLKFDPLSRPIMLLSVTAENMKPIQLKMLTEKIFKDNLEKVEGVASAVISGGADRQIFVDIDQARLHANRLSLLEVIDQIEKSNVTYPAGSIKKGLYEYLIRTVGEYRSVKEIAYSVAGTDTVKKIKREDTSFLEKGEGRGLRNTLDSLRDEVAKQMLEKRLVLVKDIAEVTDGTAERTSISRHNNHENVSLSIQKQANANTIQVVDRIMKTLHFLGEDIESRGLRYDIIYDHSVFIRKSLEDLTGDAITGAMLAFIILFVSLRSLLPAILTTLAIPMTVIGTFFLMSLGGITINTMSLGGLALGAGMIVDASIVVLENIFSKREQGLDPYEAAIQGTREVTWPVITSNATTIAVFLPLIIFVPGIPGQLFRDLSWAIIYSQIISTVLPLTFVPMMSVHLKVKKQEYKPVAWTGFLEKKLVGAHIPRKQKLVFCATILAGVFLICLLTVSLIAGRLEKEVLPKVDQGQFLVKVEMPLGTRLEVTDLVCGRLEGLLKQIPEIKNMAVTIGSEKGGKGAVKLDTLRPSQAHILVTLTKERKRSSADVVRDIEARSQSLDRSGGLIEFIVAESEFSFAEGGNKPVQIELKGYEFKPMMEWVEKIKIRLAEIPGIKNIQDDMGKTSPETKLNIDKRRAALYGISALDISLIAKAGLGGVVPTQYREQGKEYDILVRLSENDRKNVQNVGELLLYSKVLETLIPLKEVASIQQSTSPSEIKRLDQERTILISAEIDGAIAKNKDVLPEVRRVLGAMAIPEDSGVQVALSGKAREIKESFDKVFFAFILAFALVYMIMAAQFESFLQPAIIMVTVPLAFTGILLALAIGGHSINVISALGSIILVGTVVANGIMLIETINQYRSEGLSIEEASLKASKTRTRPILMSMFTSVAGLIPLALGLGEGAELRSPMAVSMMGGLLSSTFLTLIVLPCFNIFALRGLEALLGEPGEDSEDTSQSQKDFSGDGGRD